MENGNFKKVRLLQLMVTLTNSEMANVTLELVDHKSYTLKLQI